MKIHKELFTCLDIFSIIDKRLKIGMFSINVDPRGEGIINKEFPWPLSVLEGIEIFKHATTMKILTLFCFSIWI